MALFEKRGQRLEKVDQVHLIQASGEPVLQNVEKDNALAFISLFICLCYPTH